MKVGADTSRDVVAHLPAPGESDPVITAYHNDLTAVPSDKANLTVAHTASVPPADIRVNGKVLFEDIANGRPSTWSCRSAPTRWTIVPTGRTRRSSSVRSS